MQQWILEIMEAFGYLGIALLITLENVFPPIPSEVILTFGGFMTTYSSLHIPGVVFAATIGSVLGAVVLYEAGTILSQEKLEKLLDGKIGKILHFKKEDVAKSMASFHRFGPSAVFFCRCIPIVRSLISIPAGMTKMPRLYFYLLTAVGSTIWNIVLVSLGAFAGASWENMLVYIDRYSNALLVGLVTFVVCTYLFSKLKKAKK